MHTIRIILASIRVQLLCLIDISYTSKIQSVKSLSKINTSVVSVSDSDKLYCNFDIPILNLEEK